MACNNNGIYAHDVVKNAGCFSEFSFLMWPSMLSWSYFSLSLLFLGFWTVSDVSYQDFARNYGFVNPSLGFQVITALNSIWKTKRVYEVMLIVLLQRCFTSNCRVRRSLSEPACASSLVDLMFWITLTSVSLARGQLLRNDTIQFSPKLIFTN